MGNTRDEILGRSVLPPGTFAARSPGSLGRNDAGDPDAGVCLAGDTPGPIGIGGDAAASLISQESLTCEATIPVLAVDLNRLRSFLYSVTYAEAIDGATTRGFGGSEVNFGDEKAVEAAARSSADALLAEFQQIVSDGPAAIDAFLATLDNRRAKARGSLDEKFAAARQAGNRWTSVLGGAVKVLSVVKFGSTVTIKTVSIFTGAAGTGIDWAYSGTQAGLKQWQSNAPGQSVSGVVIDETLNNVGQEVADCLNEAVAEGLMTTTEKNRVQGLIGNYKGNAKKLQEQLATLEERLLKAMEAGKAKRARGVAIRQAEKLAKLRTLRQKTLQAMVSKGTRLGVAKKAAGKTLSFVFLASEVKDAWKEMAEELRQAD